MSSNLRVNNILPSVGTNVAIGTAGGSITLTGTVSGSSNINVGTGASISSPATNVLTLGTNNAERVRIDSSGNLNLVNTAGIMTAFKYETPALINNHFKSNSTSAGAYVRMYASAGTGQWDIYNNGANLRFSDNASAGNIQMDRPLVMNSQNIVMSSGNGIDFSATANGSGSVSSEVLDDYEIGSWTPTLTFGGGATGLTYARQFGRYVKIGNYVQVVGHFQISTVGSSTGSAVVGGLPFNYGAITGGYFVPMGVRGGLNVSGLPSVSFYVSSGGGSTLPIYVCGTSGGGNATVGHTAFATNTEIDICVSYYI